MIYISEIPDELYWKHTDAIAFYLHLKLKAWDKPHKTSYKGKKIKLDSFEVPYSIRDIMKVTAFTQYKVQKMLSKLIDLNMIETSTRRGFTSIRIIEPQLRIDTP